MLGVSSGTLLQLLAALMTAYEQLEPTTRLPPQPAEPLSSYDFVVVGAGASGAALAARLAQHGGWKVALFEAGGDAPIEAAIPAFVGSLQRNKNTDWAYRTEPEQLGCQGLIGNRSSWPRGKMVGGSGSINYMAYVRGHVLDFNTWESLGNPGWGHDGVLPYFERAEGKSKHGLLHVDNDDTDGPITVASLPKAPYSEIIETAAVELGHAINQPLSSSEYQPGFGNLRNFVRQGKRCSSAKGYLESATPNPNIHLFRHALVQRVIFSGTKAIGVEVFIKNKLYKILCDKEVVLSAGAINSPQLLMLSGIGPKDQLLKYGIEQIIDLPHVGQNLQDHVSFLGPTFIKVK